MRRGARGRLFLHSLSVGPVLALKVHYSHWTGRTWEEGSQVRIMGGALMRGQSRPENLQEQGREGWGEGPSW